MYGSELSSGLGQNMGFEGGAHLCKLTVPYETSTATAVYVNNHSFFFFDTQRALGVNNNHIVEWTEVS